jgi:hypothetical protein
MPGALARSSAAIRGQRLTATALLTIPEALRARPQWVAYALEERGGKTTKIPKNARSGANASSTASATWATFAEARQAVTRFALAGVGYVFAAEDPFIGVDVDDCRDPQTGALEDWAQEIVNRLDSYTEESQSGTGLHVIVTGNLPDGWRKCGSVEMYSAGRFFVMTGAHISGTPESIEERTQGLAEIQARYAKPAPEVRTSAPSPTLADRELLDKAFRAKNGGKIEALYRGDTGGYPSASEPDLALCSLLAFYTPDAGQLDRLFRASGLYRPKWDERRGELTYGQMTVGKALAGQTATYSGNGAHSTAGSETRAAASAQGATPKRWPDDAAPEAFYGLLGDVVREVGPHTEADPHGVLSGALVGFGNAAGDDSHYMVGADRHTPRIFGLIVGESSKSRKGTGWSVVEALLRRANPAWADAHIVSGLSSGEGLIHSVRDPVMRHEPVKEGGRVVSYQDVEVDAGIADKRLLVVESEFGRTLKVAGREGNVVSPVLRQAWDSGNLRVMTKTPATATGAHISVLGQVTKDELLRELSSTDLVNGLANRFVFQMVRRSKTLPDGGRVPPDVFETLSERIAEALLFAATCGQMTRDAEARDLWHAVYPELSGDRPGMFGAVTARAEAQVLRLSMIYALADLSSAIRRPHLDAALALWKRAEDSALYLFGDLSGDNVKDAIIRALRVQGEMSATDISNLFARHVKAERIASARDSLLSAGLAESYQAETAGRPVTMWKAAGR